IQRLYFNSGSLEKVIEFYEQKLKESPENPYLWYKLGRLQTQNRNYEKSEHCFKRSLKYDSNYYQAKHGLILLNEKHGKLFDTEIMFKKLLKEYPEDYKLLNNLGICYQKQENLDDSIEYFEKALAQKPDLY